MVMYSSRSNSNNNKSRQSNSIKNCRRRGTGISFYLWYGNNWTNHGSAFGRNVLPRCSAFKSAHTHTYTLAVEYCMPYRGQHTHAKRQEMSTVSSPFVISLYIKHSKRSVWVAVDRATAGLYRVRVLQRRGKKKQNHSIHVHHTEIRVFWQHICMRRFCIHSIEAAWSLVCMHMRVCAA